MSDEPMHICQASGCARTIPHGMLMCKIHWYRVPLDIQRRVWRHFKPGAAKQSDEHRQAVRDAIQAVAQREGLA